LEYDFAKEWRLKDLTAASYSTLFSRVEDSADIAARWMVLYSTSHVAASLTLESFHALSCASGNISVQAYQSCLAQKKPIMQRAPGFNL
jgi:hypothetical protein